MPDTFARMRQLVGSTTEWATNDLVIGLGEIAIERAGGEFRIKVGDGSSRFSALPYASGAAATVAWGNVTGKPAAFPPSAHTHPLTDVVGLVDGAGKLSMAIVPDTLKERLDWRGEHTPAAGAQYPPGTPASGDTWGILGPAFTFTTGTLSGKTVSEGAAIVFDAARWHIIGGGAGGGGGSGEFVEVADLTTVSTGPTMAGKVPQLNTAGRLDPSLMNVPGSLQFRGTVDITQPPPVGVNSGDYWLVGIGGVAHAGWTGIAGQTLAVNDMVIWNGVQWTYTHTAGAASGFVPIDGSAPMTGALSLAAYGAGQPVAANAIRKDYLDAQLAEIPTAEDSLGFLPLNPANNLSELTDDPTARNNLGLTATATMPPSAFILASSYTAAKQIPIATAPGVGGMIAAPTGPNLLLATTADSEVAWRDDWFLDAAQNLADVPDKALARSNLGVPDLSDIILKSTVDAAGDLIMGTADNTVARLPKGTAGQILTSTAGGIAWGTGGQVLVADITLASPSNEFRFALPAGIRGLNIEFVALFAAAGGTLGFNGTRGGTLDGANIYSTLWSQTWFAGSASSTSQYVGAATSFLLSNVPQTYYWGRVTLYNPVGTTNIMGIGDTASVGLGSSFVRGRNNYSYDMVNTITPWNGLVIYSGNNMLVGSWMRAYSF